MLQVMPGNIAPMNAGPMVVMSTAIIAPARHAVAQTFERDLVSEPIIWPAAYIAPARTIMSMAAIGMMDISPTQSWIAAIFAPSTPAP